MRKYLLLVTVFVLMSTVSCFAIGAGVGVRAMGMGGTGIATANDITAAYFNPAGLMYGPENFEQQTFSGGATQGLTDLIDVLSGPDFITNHFGDSYDLSASVNGGMGFSFRKVGLSVLIPSGYVSLDKEANALDFTLLGSMNAIAPLTLGSSFSTPGLPIASMSVGVNLKAIASGTMYTRVRKNGTVGEGLMYSSIGSGFGFDIGAATKITPFISAGAVIRNLSASTSVVTTTKTITVDAGTGDVHEGPETKTTSSVIPPPEVGIGVGFVVPIIGTLIAVDLENYSLPGDGYNINKSETYTDTHIGIEQGFFMNLVMLRCGYFTYKPAEDNYYTLGLGLNLGPASIGAATANSVKDSKDSTTSAQVGIAF